MKKINEDNTNLPKKIEAIVTVTAFSIEEMQAGVASCATSATSYCVGTMQTDYGFMYGCIEARLVH